MTLHLTPRRWRYLRKLGFTRREMWAGARHQAAARWICPWRGHRGTVTKWNGGNPKRICDRCGSLYPRD